MKISPIETDEILDLVDENDVVIQSLPRLEIYARKLKYIRSVQAFLVNDKGELWIPRRTAIKQILPLALDMSVSGHIKSGETYEQAFIRELAEELNWGPEDIAFTCIGYLTPKDHGVSAFMKVFEIKTNLTPDYNKKDFVEASWMFPKDLLSRIEAGDTSKSELPRLVKLFYLGKAPS